MCYSAQIWADFRKYERFGGKLAIKEFTKLAGWTKQKGNWVKVVPKAMRRAMADATSGVLDIGIQIGDEIRCRIVPGWDTAPTYPDVHPTPATGR